MDDFERSQYRAFSLQQRIELNQARAAETDREILLEAMEKKALEMEKQYRSFSLQQRIELKRP